jgi:hypothetical protein
METETAPRQTPRQPVALVLVRFVSTLSRSPFLRVAFYPFLNVSLYDAEAETRGLRCLHRERSA